MAKILEARHRGILSVLNKAASETKKSLPPHLARAFQHSNMIEQADRLFLEAYLCHLFVLSVQTRHCNIIMHDSLQPLHCTSDVCRAVHGYGD